MAKKILLADDEPNIVKVIELRLKSEGYEILTAYNGEEAISKIKENKPDIAILDVMMPPPNGYQICRILKEDAEYKNIPIILLTAKSTESDKFWGIESGADAYITKPYNAKELLETVKKLIKQT